MEESRIEQFLFNSLLSKGLATEGQLRGCIDDKRNTSRAFSGLLLEKGFATQSQLLLLLDEYKKEQEDSAPEVAMEAEFGIAAVKEGHTSSADVWQALEEQEDSRRQGAEGGLPQLLASRGTLNVEQIRNILDSQGRAILRCESCEKQYNVENYSPKKNYTCLSCGGALVLPDKLDTASVEGAVVDDDAEKGKIDDMFVGKEIRGCKILKRLGEGGMGAVYKGKDMALNRLVAIKIQSLALVGDLHRKMFLREARAAAQLEHPNVVQVYATGEHAGCHYIMMQYVDGEDLNSKMLRDGALSEDDALRIILEAARGLSAAHKRGMIHRDIKPGNIMVTKEGQVKVADFGLVKSLEIEKDITGFTKSMLMGTPHYMAPEQFDGKVDARADVYALGITFYFLLTNKIPFSGNTPFQIRDAHVSGSYPDIQEVAPHVSPPVARVVRKMMSVDPAERHASATELVEDLEKVKGVLAGEREDEDVILVSDTDLEKTLISSEVKEARRGRWWIAVLIVAIVAAGVLALVLAGPWKEKEPPVVQEPDLEEEAGATFAALKEQVDNLLPQQKFYESLQVLARFPEKYSQTRAQKDVDAERTRVVQEAIILFEQLLAQASQLRQAGQFKEAAAASRKILERLGKIEKDIGHLPVAETVTRMVKKVSEAGKGSTRELDRLEDFAQAKDHAETLISQEKLDEAQQKMLPFAEDKIDSIRTQANEVLSRIARKREDLEKTASAAEAARRKTEAEKQEREGFEKAKQLAAQDRKKKQFISAKGRITPFADSRLEDVRKEAQRILDEIAREEKAYNQALAQQELYERVDGELKLAEDALAAGSYRRAKELSEKHTTDMRIEENQRKRAKQITERAGDFLKFEEDIRKVDRLVSEKRIDEAKKILSKWRKSTERKIASAAAEKHADMLRIAEPGMVFLRSGTFTVGSADPKDQNPQKTVRIEGLYLDKYEVTNTEYAKFVKVTSHKPPSHWPNGFVPRGQQHYPVTGVTHKDAAAYATWAGKRLPTEEEWEVAAALEKGALRLYPWGEKYVHNACNIKSGKPQPVGSFPKDKSSSGVVDMAGNVCEWTASKDKDGVRYAVRGGDWGCRSQTAARTTYRFLAKPDMSSARLGFRCAKDAK